MRAKVWPLKTKTDCKAIQLLGEYWIKEFNYTPEQVIDSVWKDWPYFDILYTTTDDGELQVSVDLRDRFTRAELLDYQTGAIYIHDEYWVEDRTMLEDLEYLDFQSWFEWAAKAIYSDRQYEEEVDE